MGMKLFLSWVFLLAGAVYGAHLSYSGQIAVDPLAAALSTGYASWGLYWGVPVVWRWWWPISPRRRDRSVLGRIFWLMVDFALPLIGGYFYGVFGGGIYHCLKAWMSVRKRRA